MSPMSEQGKRILENLQRLDVEERSVVGLPYAWEVCSSLTGWGARVEVDIPTADFVDPDMEVVGRRKLVLNPDLAEALREHHHLKQRPPGGDGNAPLWHAPSERQPCGRGGGRQFDSGGGRS